MENHAKNLVHTQLDIQGMHCASCALVIEKSLKELPGVSNAAVNFGNEKAHLTHDASLVKVEDLVKAVEHAGYHATLSDRANHSRHYEETIKVSTNRFIISAVLSAPFMLFMLFSFIPSLPGASSILPLTGLFGFLLATPVQFILGAGFYKGLLANLRVKTFGMDSLVALGTSAAYFFSLYNFIVYAFQNKTILAPAGMMIPDLYFETSALLITFVLLGKLLENRTKAKAGDAIQKLAGLRAKTARVYRDGKTVDIPVENLKIGEVVIIRPGETVPMDSKIVKGSSTLDESMITGESLPVEKREGDEITGGTINRTGSLEAVVQKVGDDTLLARIIRLVEEAQGSKAPIQGFADKVAARFVPAVLIISALTFIVWLLLGAGVNFAILSAVSVLVIACPCALGLATPTALMAGTGRGAELGILIKGGEPLELTEKINTIVLDKTGTLTLGKPQVTDVTVLDSQTQDELLRLAGSLERNSEHVLADTIYKHAEAKNIKLDSVDSFQVLSGLGVTGNIAGKKYYFGNRSLLAQNEINFASASVKISDLESEGKTVMLLADESSLLGLIAVADALKPTSVQAVKDFHALGLEVWMLTGDNERTAAAIAAEVGIKNFRAGILPAQKAAEVKKLQAQGKHVLMVGDGVNDAPALAQAEVGVAMGSGTDVAMETGGIVIMKDDLKDVAVAIRLARATMGKIRQNMFWALAYNAAGIPIAARVFAFAGLILKPELAGLAMALSSVSVVSNSLLLKLFGRKN